MELDPIPICDSDCYAYLDARFAQSLTIAFAHKPGCVTDRGAESRRVANAIRVALTDPVDPAIPADSDR